MGIFPCHIFGDLEIDLFGDTLSEMTIAGLHETGQILHKIEKMTQAQVARCRKYFSEC